jgi:hypothetical protein
MATRKSRKQLAKGQARSAEPQADANDGSGNVRLRFVDSAPIDLTIALAHNQVASHARDWNHRLRDRRRWATREAGVKELRTDAREFVNRLGISADIIERVARQRIVQIDLASGDAEMDVALRTLPWEYLLATATRPLRGKSPFAVVRRLRTKRGILRQTPPRGWLMIESAPGVLRQHFDFSDEHEIIDRCARANGTELKVVRDPSPQSLAKQLSAARSYDVVHVAGLDIYQAIHLMERNLPERTALPSTESLIRGARGLAPMQLQEAYTLADGERTMQAIQAPELASILCSGKTPPRIVTFNIYNSAYQIAYEAVAAGARSAIAFQDTFDDQLAEEFFATFFRAWAAAKWNPISAFSYAWQQIRARGLPLQGSGLVLWTDQPLEDTELISEAVIRRSTRAPVKQLSAENVRDLLQVNIEPIDELNYSILHNNGPLFSEFVIKKKNPHLGEVSGLKIDVELHVGTDTYPFRTTAFLGYSEQQYDLSRDVRVSLASALNRALRENVRTSLFVEVQWNDVTLHRETYRVTLLSVDEWRDDETNRKWLPSFVLPRDPVVPQIIERAQKYLMALLDDSTSGFDGYQSVDEDPGRKHPATACTCIDLQVRAIWSALIYDTPLAYINPPPTFTDSSQRLRTPSDVVLGKRGTCIDLALLLASCLEYVEIYPAIILLKTHAFPAYWRHWVYHEKFSQARPVDSETVLGRAPDSDPALMRSRGQSYSWYFDQPEHYREIVGAVQAGRLVPLETVSLTARAGYAEALAEGHKNLGSRREFDSMLDIQLARTDEHWRVTPLPILKIET